MDLSVFSSLDLAGRPQDTRIVVAMSGGVDSSVVAAGLKAQGYDVVGVTLQLYHHGEATHRKGACCAGQDIYDAQRVAERMGFPHYILDYEEKFRKSVIDPFARSYLDGETPIPCVSCNQSVKFHDLLQTARDLGAQAMATGHYVASRQRPDGHRALYAASDHSRDQSYFLYATTQEQLDFVRFPLGDLTKPQVRELAQRFGLEIADKPDSQDICFVPQGRYTDVIERLNPGALTPGDIVHCDGGILGQHQGIVHYTVGQRKGLGLAAAEPLYVLRLEAATARVIVGPKSKLAIRHIHLRDINWIGDGLLEEAARQRQEILVKVRSARAPVTGWLDMSGANVIITLSNPETGIAPGQAAVIYDAQMRVLGGGVITADRPLAMVSESALDAVAG